MRLVLFFTWDVSLELWEKGGLLQRELKLYQQLAAKGVEIILVTWGDERDAKIAESLVFCKVIPLYKRIPWFTSKVIRFALSFLAPLFLKDVITNQTILKTNQMWGGWVALISKYLYRRPLIVRTGFELYDFTVREGHGYIRKAFIWLISAITYNGASHIFLATRTDSDFVQKSFFIKERKITICPNWIDTDVFSPNTGKNEGILFVGRLNRQKNLPALIQAVNDTPYSLKITGAGELEADLKKISGQNISFTGTVANDLMPEEYRDCAVYVLPSFYEGNPKTLLEAMSCGAAVIGADVPGIREIIEHQQTGVLCAPEKQSLKEAIIYLMEQPETRKNLGRNARGYILANNTLASQVERELECLNRLNSEIV